MFYIVALYLDNDPLFEAVVILQFIPKSIAVYFPSNFGGFYDIYA